MLLGGCKSMFPTTQLVLFDLNVFCEMLSKQLVSLSVPVALLDKMLWC